jgi:hypothetical protein
MRALEIALCLHSNGQLDTLAWAAAGMPETGFGPEDIEVLKVARQVIHQNGGVSEVNDVGRVLALLRKRREGRR